MEGWKKMEERKAGRLEDWLQKVVYLPAFQPSSALGNRRVRYKKNS
jgi:hypothetical protein